MLKSDKVLYDSYACVFFGLLQEWNWIIINDTGLRSRITNASIILQQNAILRMIFCTSLPHLARSNIKHRLHRPKLCDQPRRAVRHDSCALKNCTLQCTAYKPNITIRRKKLCTKIQKHRLQDMQYERRTRWAIGQCWYSWGLNEDNIGMQNADIINYMKANKNEIYQYQSQMGRLFGYFEPVYHIFRSFSLPLLRSSENVREATFKMQTTTKIRTAAKWMQLLTHYTKWTHVKSVTDHFHKSAIS